jgi:hypothetical protein
MPWTRIGHYGVHSALPTILTPTFQPAKDPVPMLQVFGERYRDGRLHPPHHKPVKARTVEDGIHALGQVHVRLGGLDPRKDAHVGIYFWIQLYSKAYMKDDAPPKHVKPAPIIIIIFIISGHTLGRKNSHCGYDCDCLFISPLTRGIYMHCLGRCIVQDAGCWLVYPRSNI